MYTHTLLEVNKLKAKWHDSNKITCNIKSKNSLEMSCGQSDGLVIVYTS